MGVKDKKEQIKIQRRDNSELKSVGLFNTSKIFADTTLFFFPSSIDNLVKNTISSQHQNRHKKVLWRLVCLGHGSFAVHQVVIIKKHTHRLSENAEDEPEDHVAHHGTKPFLQIVCDKYQRHLKHNPHESP